eukprot:COSAG05_NODE_33_length_28089_cov_31.909289_6_plen_121_part_00
MKIDWPDSINHLQQSALSSPGLDFWSPSIVGDPLTPEFVSWQLSVMQLRIQEHGQAKPEPKVAYYGKIILPSSLLCPSVIRPTAHTDWKAPIQPRQSALSSPGLDFCPPSTTLVFIGRIM